MAVEGVDMCPYWITYILSLSFHECLVPWGYTLVESNHGTSAGMFWSTSQSRVLWSHKKSFDIDIWFHLGPASCFFEVQVILMFPIEHEAYMAVFQYVYTNVMSSLCSWYTWPRAVQRHIAPAVRPNLIRALWLSAYLVYVQELSILSFCLPLSFYFVHQSTGSLHLLSKLGVDLPFLWWAMVERLGHWLLPWLFSNMRRLLQAIPVYSIQRFQVFCQPWGRSIQPILDLRRLITWSFKHLEIVVIG